MLFIQNICLTWGKKERGSVYADMRKRLPSACSIDQLPDRFCGDVVMHHLYFHQTGTKFHTLHIKDAYHFQYFSSVQDLNLTNLLIQTNPEGYEVTFFYDETRSGRPVRRGHNKDYHNIESPLYRHDMLNETAFFLKPEQYGRIHWNERKIDYDTGEWYYQWHIINLLHNQDRMPEKDIFRNRKPDFEYKQMAVLY